MNIIENYLHKTGKTKYRLSKDSGIPYSTVSDICTGKTPLRKCSAGTIYRLSSATGLSCDDIITSAVGPDGNPEEKTPETRTAMFIPEELRHCFWDTKMDELDPERNKDFIIARLYTKGGISGIAYVSQIYSPEDIIHAAKVSRDLNPIVANYLSRSYGISRDQMAYYKIPEAGRSIWGH